MRFHVVIFIKSEISDWIFRARGSIKPFSDVHLWTGYCLRASGIKFSAFEISISDCYFEIWQILHRQIHDHKWNDSEPWYTGKQDHNVTTRLFRRSPMTQPDSIEPYGCVCVVLIMLMLPNMSKKLRNVMCQLDWHMNWHLPVGCASSTGNTNRSLKKICQREQLRTAGNDALDSNKEPRVLKVRNFFFENSVKNSAPISRYSPSNPLLGSHAVHSWF